VEDVPLEREIGWAPCVSGDVFHSGEFQRVRGGWIPEGGCVGTYRIGSHRRSRFKARPHVAAVDAGRRIARRRFRRGWARASRAPQGIPALTFGAGPTHGSAADEAQRGSDGRSACRMERPDRGCPDANVRTRGRRSSVPHWDKPPPYGRRRYPSVFLEPGDQRQRRARQCATPERSDQRSRSLRGGAITS
jgi:hypothetical protein